MYWYLYPLLKKEPDHILLHVGSNNAMSMPADEILSNLIGLKNHIEKLLPECNVVISQPILRIDNMDASATMNELIRYINNLDIKIMDNSNISREYLGQKDLHLSMYGTKRLAMNIINWIRGL